MLEISAKQYPGGLTKRQAAEFLQCSLHTVHRRINDGSLRAVRVGPTSIRIDADSVAALAVPARGQQAAANPLDEHVEKIVAGWPKLSARQLDRIAALLRTGAGAVRTSKSLDTGEGEHAAAG